MKRRKKGKSARQSANHIAVSPFSETSYEETSRKAKSDECEEEIADAVEQVAAEQAACWIQKIRVINKT